VREEERLASFRQQQEEVAVVVAEVAAVLALVLFSSRARAIGKVAHPRRPSI